MSDPITDGVQPQEGQGATGQSDTAPWAEYLNRIPEEARGAVEPIFQEWDANVTRRFQEASEYRKQWEPYEQAGINQLGPEGAQWAAQFYQAANQNPQAIKEWYEQYAASNGLAETAPAAAAEPSLDDLAGLYTDTPNIEQILKQQLEPLQQQIQQVVSWREQQEQQAREQEALRMIEGQIAELKSQNPDAFAGPGEKAIEALIANHIETDPHNAVRKAFDDWSAIRGQLEKDFLQSKADAPAPPETGGVADGAPEQIKSLADASRIAMERIRASRGI